jgi:4-hydroxy-tetrahydrodipicolinate reductase
MPVAEPLDVILFGVGALGSLVIDCLKPGAPMIRVVGAVDIDPAKAGRRLAELYPDFRDAGDLVVAPDLAGCLARLAAPADVLLHMTESVPERIEADLIAALNARLHVISASEAMFHVGLRSPAVAARVDAAAKANGVSVAGLGINPGFSFDALPLMLARTTCDVKRITISRTIDVTGTGPGDIDHVGYGLPPDEFRSKIASGQIVGHMGGPESVACVAERLGLEIDRVEESWDTETASFPVDSGTSMLGMIPPSRVIGITQRIIGMRAAEVVIDLSLVMYYQPERFGLVEADVVDIEGAHHVRASLRPAAVSLFGAANAIVNAVHDVAAAEPGLVHMLDFSIGGTWRGGFRYVVDGSMTPRPGVIPLKRLPI